MYALGTVLYEMLAGEPPFTGPTAQAVIAKRFSGEVPKVRAARPSVPEHVAHATTRALAPVAADRFASAAEFGKALTPSASATGAPVAAPRVSTPAARAPAAPTRRKVPTGLLLLLVGFLVGVGVLFAWRRGGHAAKATGGRTIAVLPFQNQGDSTQEYFADGITDAVRGKLSEPAGRPGHRGRKLPGLQEQQQATPRNRPRARRGLHHGRQGALGENADGTSRVQLSPELVDLSGAAPTTKWQQPFDASLTDVFKVQADIAGQVAQALDVALADSVSRQLAARPTANLPRVRRVPSWRADFRYQRPQ